jgi:hypothetical protein
MPLCSSRFYLSGYLHYYGHLRLPRQHWTLAALGYPTFMRNLWLTRNIILPRVAFAVLFTVSSSKVAGFIISESLTSTNSVTRLNWCSLSTCSLWALIMLFPSLLSQLLSPVRQIGWYGTFIHIGLLYLRTLRGAPETAKKIYPGKFVLQIICSWKEKKTKRNKWLIHQ